MANQNASHAMIQHTSLGFKNYNGFKVNGEFLKLQELHNLETLINNEDISTNLAVLLAAAVDNAKEPVLGELNANLFTSNVLTTLLRQGLDMRTSMLFINQPVIVKLSELYFNKGGNPYSAIQAFNEVEEKLKAIANIPNAPEVYPKYKYSIIEDSMLIKGLKEVDPDNLGELTEEQARNQLRVLNVFEDINKKAEDLSKVIKAFRADSIKAGPTMAANSIFLDNYYNVRNNPLSSFNEGDVNDAFEKYYMQAEFAGVIAEANNNLGKHLIWNNVIFSDARKKLQAIKGKNPLREDEIEFLNYNLFSYFASGFDFFDLTSNEMKYYIEEFPQKYQEKIEEDDILKELFITKLIGIDTKHTDPKILPRLKFNTDSKLSAEQKDTLYDQFLYLLNHKNTEYQKLAEDLIKYSFAVSGLRYTPFSLNSIIPIQAFDLIKDSKGESFNNFLKYKLEDILENAAISNEVLEENSEFNYQSEDAPIDKFMTSFIRNFAHRFDYITEIDLKKEKAEIKENKPGQNSFPTSIKININNTSSNVIYTVDGKPLAKDFITYTVNNITYLYKLMGTNDNGREIYYAVQAPLGIPNRAQELGIKYEGNAFLDKTGLKLYSVVEEDGKAKYKVIYIRDNDLNKLGNTIDKARERGSFNNTIEDYFYIPTRYTNTINQEINTNERQEEEGKKIEPDTTQQTSEVKEVADGVKIIDNALTSSEELEMFNMIKPFLESQGSRSNKGKAAPIMIGMGLRWDYKSNNPGKSPVEIKETIVNSQAQRNKYAYYDVSIDGEALGAIPTRLKELMTKATGIDASNYDGAIINIYPKNGFISAHNDVDESVTAINYPVIVANIGGAGSLSIEGAESQKARKGYSSKEYVNEPLSSGSAYIFGEDGKNRNVFHRTLPSSGKGNLPQLNIKGQIIPANSYRISVTLRRVKDLEPGMPITPNKKSQPTQQTSEVKSIPTQPQAGTINIYAGTNENVELSNFAKRPFEAASLDETSIINMEEWGYTYNTVEGAFQAAKLFYTDSYDLKTKKVLAKKLSKMTGAKAKSAGRKIEGLNTTKWDQDSFEIMNNLISDSFDQNKDAIAALLATGDAKLTHTQDKSKWGKQFPEILMRTRDLFKQLTEQLTGKAPKKYLTTKKEYFEENEVEDQSLVSVETFGEQKVVVDEGGMPINRKKGYKDFYALNRERVSDTGTEEIKYFFRKTYAKKVNIPGYEMLNAVVVQWSKSTYVIFEASSGMRMGGEGTTIKEAIEGLKKHA